MDASRRCRRRLRLASSTTRGIHGSSWAIGSRVGRGSGFLKTAGEHRGKNRWAGAVNKPARPGAAQLATKIYASFAWEQKRYGSSSFGCKATVTPACQDWVFLRSKMIAWAINDLHLVTNPQTNHMEESSF